LSRSLDAEAEPTAGKLLVATAASVEKWHPRQWRGRYRPLQLVPPWDSRIAGVVVPKEPTLMWISDGDETSSQKKEGVEGRKEANEVGTGGMARVKLEGGMDPMKPLEGGMDRAKLCEGGMDRAKLCEGGMDPTKPDRSGGRMTRMTAGGIMTWMTGEGERMAGGMRIGGHHDAERKERIEGEEEGDPGKEGIWVPEEACSGMGGAGRISRPHITTGGTMTIWPDTGLTAVATTHGAEDTAAGEAATSITEVAAVFDGIGRLEIVRHAVHRTTMAPVASLRRSAVDGTRLRIEEGGCLRLLQRTAWVALSAPRVVDVDPRQVAVV